jgi:uncharacterized membrane protein HdeD (DUF308 family)
MVTAYIVVTALAAAANIWAATNDFRRLEWITANLDRLKMPRSWLPTLGILKVLGGIGLLVGFVLPWVGVAAAIGLILFFIGACISAVRVRWYQHLPYPTVWLLLAAGALVLRVHTVHPR